METEAECAAAAAQLRAGDTSASVLGPQYRAYPRCFLYAARLYWCAAGRVESSTASGARAVCKWAAPAGARDPPLASLSAQGWSFAAPRDAGVHSGGGGGSQLAASLGWVIALLCAVAAAAAVAGKRRRSGSSSGGGSAAVVLCSGTAAGRGGDSAMDGDSAELGATTAACPGVLYVAQKDSVAGTGIVVSAAAPLPTVIDV